MYIYIHIINKSYFKALGAHGSLHLERQYTTIKILNIVWTLAKIVSAKESLIVTKRLFCFPTIDVKFCSQ